MWQTRFRSYYSTLQYGTRDEPLVLSTIGKFGPGAGLNLLTEIPTIAGARKETFALSIKAVYDSYL